MVLLRLPALNQLPLRIHITFVSCTGTSPSALCQVPPEACSWITQIAVLSFCYWSGRGGHRSYNSGSLLVSSPLSCQHVSWMPQGDFLHVNSSVVRSFPCHGILSLLNWIEIKPRCWRCSYREVLLLRTKDLENIMSYRPRLSRTRMRETRRRERVTPRSMNFGPSCPPTGQVSAQFRATAGRGDYHDSQNSALNLLNRENNSRRETGWISLDGQRELAQDVWNPVTPLSRRVDQTGDLVPEMAPNFYCQYAPDMGMPAEVQDLHRIPNQSHQPQLSLSSTEVRGNGLPTSDFEANHLAVSPTEVSHDQFASLGHEVRRAELLKFKLLDIGFILRNQPRVTFFRPGAKARVYRRISAFSTQLSMVRVRLHGTLLAKSRVCYSMAACNAVY